MAYSVTRVENFNTYCIYHFLCDSSSDLATIVSDYTGRGLRAGWTAVTTENDTTKAYILANDLSTWAVYNIGGGSGGDKKEVVQSLPQEGDPDTTYYVGPLQDGQGNDYFEEWVWIEKSAGVWGYEALGSTAAIDLSGYATITYVNNKLTATLTQLSDGTYSLTFGTGV